MDKTEKAILVVSFGTTYPETREKTIGAIEERIRKAYPDRSVRRCFTSGMIIARLLKRDGIRIDDPEAALKRAADDGIKELIVQPTHLMDGVEYHKLLSIIKESPIRFEKLSVCAPLLSDENDFNVIAEAVLSHLPDPGKENAVLLMGHGTDAPSNAVYMKMQECLHQKGADHYYIATVEGEPLIEDLLPVLREKGYKKIILAPFMIVAGDHATNDLAGDTEDSWKGILLKEGFEVETALSGIGEWTEVQELFVKHAAAAV